MPRWRGSAVGSVFTNNVSIGAPPKTEVAKLGPDGKLYVGLSDVDVWRVLNPLSPSFTVAGNKVERVGVSGEVGGVITSMAFATYLSVRAIGALTRRLPAAPVLVDTPGCDPFDPTQVEELTALAAAISGIMVLVLPADHVVAQPAAFRKAVGVAAQAAAAGSLVTFGVVPTAPETGYGYIRRGAAAGPAYRIAQFVEKPDAQRAAQFLASGEYYWNSGMFLFQVGRYLSELARLAPDIAASCELAWQSAARDLDFTRAGVDAFKGCRSESIDYAVMEKTSDAQVVPLDAGWSDVGSWSSLQAACPSDGQGNVLRGDVITEDTQGCYIYAESRLVGIEIEGASQKVDLQRLLLAGMPGKVETAAA